MMTENPPVTAATTDDWVIDTAPVIDRNLLVAELRRQVALTYPAGNDDRSWRQVMTNLADSLACTDWCAPGTDPLSGLPQTRVVHEMPTRHKGHR